MNEKNWNNTIGNNSSYEMQCVKPDHNMCQIDEVPTNLQMKEIEIASEVPISTNIVFPPCVVALYRLTQEEINQSYPSDNFVSEEIDNYGSQTQYLHETNYYNEHNYSQSADLEERHKRKSLRDLSKHQKHQRSLEIYKRKRQLFLDRKNAAKLNSENILSQSDESDTGMSEDEFKSSGSQGKGKKKFKRGKYEHDSEWSPYTAKNNIPFEKKLRRQVRRPIIDSDSTSTDEEEILYKMYTSGDLSGDSNSINSAFQNAVPCSSENNESVESLTSSVCKIPVEKDILDNDNVSDCLKLQNSSQDNSHNVDSLPNSSSNVDILGEIMKEMDNCKRVTSNLRTLSPGTVDTISVKNIKPRAQRARKRMKSSYDIESEVAEVMRKMINSVCSEQRHKQTIDNRKFFKKCIWCHTQFSTSKADETMCNICYDQGKGKYSTSSQNKSKLPKSKVLKLHKQLPGSKIKRVSTTMSRVLKKLPKSEMQRLMYTDKNKKLSNEKGYSHCKSFITAKDSQEPADFSEKSQEMEILNKANEFRKKDSKPSVCVIENHTATSLKSDVESTNSNNDNGETKCVNLNSNKVESEKVSHKRKISLKKFNEGLFLMSFPDPDEELNINMKKDHQKQEIMKQTNTENSSRLLNSSRAAKSSDKSVCLPKNFKSIAADENYKTCLLPPICTVVIVSYASKYEKRRGNLQLSQVFFQNQFTYQHAMDPAKLNGDSPNLPGLPSCSIFNQNLIPNIMNNAALTITNIPFSTCINQIQPFISNSPLVINTSVPNNTVTILPLVSSVVSLSQEPINRNKSLTFPANNNFVNSEQLSIKITSVSSENTLDKHLNFNSECLKNGNDSSPATSKIDEEILPENVTKSLKAPIKRKHTSSEKNLALKGKKKAKKQKENNSSDTDISDNEHVGALTVIENIEANNSKVNVIVKGKYQNTVNESHENFIDKNSENESMSMDQNSVMLKSFENDSRSVEQNADAMLCEQNTDTAEQTAESLPKQSVKLAEMEDNTAHPDPINSAIDLVGAVAILGVIDLERNPPYRLGYQMDIAKEKLAKLISENNGTQEMNEKIALCRYNLKVFEIAQRYLNLYGSFTKVSEYLMRRHQMEQKIQIKKEMMDEDEDEEDTNQSSCRFSQRSQSATQLNNETLSNPSEMPSPLTIKMENVSACKLNEQASSLSHLEKLQSQIAAINNAQVNYDALPSGGTVHHYATEQYSAYTPALAAPAAVTPRNDCMGGESRETPSRGSGPRTPARPESATSQPDDQSLAIQVKREQFETVVSSPSQCAYTQNTTLTQISNQVPTMQELPVLNTGAQTLLNSTLQQISVSGTNQIYTSTQSSYQLPPISRAPPAYNNSKQSYTNVLLNLVPKPQATPSNVTSGINTNVDQTGQLLFGQQLYIPSGTGVPQKQAVPSVNNNQYVIQQPYSAPNTGGALLMNNSQVGQNVNALLTNVSNQQFYTNTSNQVPQMYYPPPTSQIACTQSTMQAPNVTVSQNQQTPTETMDQMYCAVCKNLATLRCKQCAKVAYCNTVCAKTYWHQKHKMECKPLSS